jgi:nucleoid-associated protein YgaU
MRKLFIIALILLILGQGAPRAASPTEDLMKIAAGARPMGMGKAFVAVANDGNSPFVNPAGLAKLKTWQFTSMYVNILDGDVPYTVLSGSYPFDIGNVAIGLISTGVSDIPSPTPTGFNYFDYYDRIFYVSYANSAEDILRMKNIYWGGNFKMFAKGFSGSENNSGFGLNMDVGLQYFQSEWLTLGANMQNFLPTKLTWSSGAEDEIPFLVKLGGAVKVLENDLVLAADMDFPVGSGANTLLHLGAEYPINEMFSVRGGLDQIPSAASQVSTNPTLGLGFAYQGLKLDYAYHPYYESSVDTTHYISFSYSPEMPTKEAKAAAKPDSKITKEESMPLDASAPPKTKPKSTALPVIREKPVRVAVKEKVAENSKQTIPKPEVKVEYEAAAIEKKSKMNVKKVVSHLVAYGDTLMEICEKYYGNAWLYKQVARLNKIKNPDFIVAGKRIEIDPNLQK